MSNFNIFYDGSIVGLYIIVTMALGLYVRKYVGKVEHFLVAGREVNVYLGIASLAATEFGIVTCMYAAQNGYKYGFAGATPGILYGVAMLFVGLTGFVVKPLRESGVITIPELIERSFGEKVRVASGIVIVLGGLLNMGVFLRVGGEFLLTVSGTGTAESYFRIGGFELPVLETMMTAMLLLVAVYTIFGGMLSVLVTDFLQFVVMSVGLLIVTGIIFYTIGWDQLVTTVDTVHGAGGFNPFAHEKMGFAYVIFNAMVALAAILTWQANIARVLASKDADTGRKIYTRTSFFFICRILIPTIWGIAALYLIGSNLGEKESLQAMPRMLAVILPVGVMGILIAAMLAADMSTNSSYMLTWASVIYNDILAPFRRGRKWDERKGLFINRTLVGLIGIFLLFYGLWYPIKGDLWTYLALTGTIYLASMSVILIATCYWKKANNWGAIGSIAVSAAFPIAYLVIEQLPETRYMAEAIGPHYSGILAYVGSAAAMVIGSLIKPVGGNNG
jgi:SSS family solute:Na+ symporter